MEKKLNRGRLIRKYIGEGLREEGFSYAGYKGDVWEFQRIYKENIIQLEFVTYSDREVDVLRRAVTIVHLN